MDIQNYLKTIDENIKNSEPNSQLIENFKTEISNLLEVLKHFKIVYSIGGEVLTIYTPHGEESYVPNLFVTKCDENKYHLVDNLRFIFINYEKYLWFFKRPIKELTLKEVIDILIAKYTFGKGLNLEYHYLEFDKINYSK